MQCLVFLNHKIWEYFVKDVCELTNDNSDSFKLLFEALIFTFDHLPLLFLKAWQLSLAAFHQLLAQLLLVFLEAFLKLFELGKLFLCECKPLVLVLLSKVRLEVINLFETEEEVSLRWLYHHLIVTLECHPPLPGDYLEYLFTVCFEVVRDYHHGIQKFWLIFRS